MPAESVIERLKRLEAEATKGPWYATAPCAVEYGRSVCDTRSWLNDAMATRELTQVRCKAGIATNPVEDAHFVSAMRNALPLLLRVAEAACRAVDDNRVESESGLHEAVRALRAGGSDV